MDFRPEFRRRVPTDPEAWEVQGVLTKSGHIYVVGYDTKLLSTVFELLVSPVMQVLAADLGYEFTLSSSQTIYPDFTLTPSGAGSGRVAVDVKSGYRRPGGKVQFTLGSYTSYLRNNTKNIMFPYDEYEAHWVVGFVYDRVARPTTGVVPLDERGRVISPVENVELVVARKEWISSERPGSGNTTNIGSISATPADMNAELGPFSQFEDPVTTFHEYWRNYLSRRDADLMGKTPPYSNIEEFLRWKES